MSKATMSKDGKNRFTMCITHRAGRRELINVVANKITNEGKYGYYDEDKDKMMVSNWSRTLILKLTRSCLFWDGEGGIEEYYDRFDNEWTEREQKAIEIVDRLFPELREED